MKKLLVLSLVLTMILGIVSMASAMTVSPEFEALYWSAGNSMAIGGGAVFGLAPKFGIRARAGYTLNAGKGYIFMFDGLYTMPLNPKVKINFGGGVNFSDSNLANTTGGIGAQFYGGIVTKISNKTELFVDLGLMNSSGKTLGVTARNNDFGAAFGIRANLGEQ